MELEIVGGALAAVAAAGGGLALVRGRRKPPAGDPPPLGTRERVAWEKALRDRAQVALDEAREAWRPRS